MFHFARNPGQLIGMFLPARLPTKQSPFAEQQPPSASEDEDYWLRRRSAECREVGSAWALAASQGREASTGSTMHDKVATFPTDMFSGFDT